MRNRAAKILLFLLLWVSLSGLVYGQAVIEYTKSDGQREWRIKLVLGHVDPDKQKNPYSYQTIFYPALLLPGRYMGPYRVYYEPLIKGMEDLPFCITWLKRISAADQYHRARLKGSDESRQLPPDKALPTLTPKQIDQTIRKALALFKRGKFQYSMTLLKKILIAESASPADGSEEGVTAILYGHSLFALGYYQLAVPALRKGMRLINKFEDTPMDLAEFYGKPEILKEHMAGLETWVKYNPEDMDAKFLLGYVYFFTGRPAQSQSVLAGLLESRHPDPNLPPRQAGVSGSEQGDKEAERLLKKAKQLLSQKKKPPE